MKLICCNVVNKGHGKHFFKFNYLKIIGYCFFHWQNEYEKAIPYFEKAERKGDLQATFQLGVIHYDGLLGISNYVSDSYWQNYEGGL